MSNQLEIRLSGSGGQGLILAGIILAEAAILDGKNAVQTQSYGPEARGGASKSEVIISDKEIFYPKVKECDLLLSLTQTACDKYFKTLKKGGILIIDDQINPPNTNEVIIYKLPIVKTATEKLKNVMVSNIISLGVIQKITNIVDMNSLEKSILARVPRGTEDLNKKAFQEGTNIL